MSNFFRKLFRRKRPLILMYHRIATEEIDPWELCVSLENFATQLEVIQSNYTVVPLRELVDRLQKNQSADNLIALTFDDGYRDNFTVAKKQLEQLHLPASFFITSQQSPNHFFWWDHLLALVFQAATLPSELKLKLSEETKHFSIHEFNRRGLLDQLGECIKGCAPILRRKLIDQLRDQCKLSSYHTPEIMTADELRILSSNADFEIGAHTINHPALGILSREEQKIEIFDNVHYLESLGLNIKGLAYPHGHFNADTLSLTASGPLEYALSTEQRTVRNSLRFRLPRFQVTNTQTADFEKTLFEWSAIDR